MQLSGAGVAGLLLLAFFINAALALIPASIAQSKGRSFFGFWVFGLFFFLIALVVALVVGDEHRSDARAQQVRVPCPRCAELVASGAIACRFCGLEFERPLTPPMVPARACPTDGCSERGRPTERSRCDVCDADTYPLQPSAESTS